jgi:hypothetical protein
MGLGLQIRTIAAKLAVAICCHSYKLDQGQGIKLNLLCVLPVITTALTAKILRALAHLVYNICPPVKSIAT